MAQMFPANGGKVNVKGADGITVSKSANGEMTISGSGTLVQ